MFLTVDNVIAAGKNQLFSVKNRGRQAQGTAKLEGSNSGENMGEGFLTVGRLAWLIGVALLVMIANVAISIVYMVVYSYVIDPGHDQQYYEAHIQAAAPYCSIIAAK